MIIIFNGKEAEVLAGTTIWQFVCQQGLNPKLIVVEHNYEIVKEDTLVSVELKDQDKLEIFSFVGGG